MKRQKRLIILSGVLVVCVAGAVIVSRIDFEEKMTGTETTIVDVDQELLDEIARISRISLQTRWWKRYRAWESTD